MGGTLPVAEALAPELLSLPMYPELTASQIEQVSEAVLLFLDHVETRELCAPATHS
jgi:dTDP-4-amino-4,6-dideoxygalactose transaminase